MAAEKKYFPERERTTRQQQQEVGADEDGDENVTADQTNIIDMSNSKDESKEITNTTNDGGIDDLLNFGNDQQET